MEGELDMGSAEIKVLREDSDMFVDTPVVMELFRAEKSVRVGFHVYPQMIEGDSSNSPIYKASLVIGSSTQIVAFDFFWPNTYISHRNLQFEVALTEFHGKHRRDEVFIEGRLARNLMRADFYKVGAYLIALVDFAGSDFAHVAWTLAEENSKLTAHLSNLMDFLRIGLIELSVDKCEPKNPNEALALLLRHKGSGVW